MNLERLGTHLVDALRVDGDVFTLNLTHDAGIYNLNKVSESGGRLVYNDVGGSSAYAFAFIDSNTNTDELINELWLKMTYGSTIFFSSFRDGAPMPRDKIIKRFIDLHKNEVTTARQMLIQGKREQNLIVKCFPLDKKPSYPTDDGTVTIATVFKTGGDFDVSYVNHIANSVKEHTTVPYKFVVLTDHFDGYGPNVHQVVPFEHNWPKWWGKMEMFKPNMFDTEKIFFLDLDTFIVDNIDAMLQYGGEFFGLRDFYSQHSLGSGLMCWKNHDAKIFQLYEKFMENPTANMNNNRGGDQQFIYGVIRNYLEYAQDLYPKQVVSYKKDCVKSRGEIVIPDEARIICFHGPPRPNKIKDPIIRKYWKG